MNKPMIITKDFFEHLLNCLANQKYNPPADAQEAIDKAYHIGMRMLRQSKPLDWESDANEHEGVIGEMPHQNARLPTNSLSGIDIRVITFDKLDGPGVEQEYVCGVSWQSGNRLVDDASAMSYGAGNLITAVNDKTVFTAGQAFDAIVLQTPQAALMINKARIFKYSSGVSIDDIFVEELWEYEFASITGWRKAPYAVKEGDSWKLQN